MPISSAMDKVYILSSAYSIFITILIAYYDALLRNTASLAHSHIAVGLLSIQLIGISQIFIFDTFICTYFQIYYILSIIPLHIHSRFKIFYSIVISVHIKFV